MFASGLYIMQDKITRYVDYHFTRARSVHFIGVRLCSLLSCGRLGVSVLDHNDQISVSVLIVTLLFFESQRLDGRFTGL